MFGERLASKGEQQTEGQHDGEADTDGRRQHNCEPGEDGDEESPLARPSHSRASRRLGTTARRRIVPASLPRPNAGVRSAARARTIKRRRLAPQEIASASATALRSQPGEENRQAGDEQDPRRDFGDRPEARMSNPVDPVRENAPAGHEEGREQEDFGDRGRFGEISAEEERDEPARHACRRPTPTTRARGRRTSTWRCAACQGAVALGGNLRICNEADARGYDPEEVVP